MLDADVAFEFDDNDEDEDETGPLITASSDIDVDSLTTLLMRSWFKPQEDFEYDSYDTQKHQAKQAHHKTAVEVLSGTEEALIRLLGEAAQTLMAYQIPEDAAAVITIRRTGKPQVELRHDE